ncbi:DUF4351 domain-containing protein [Nostoc sp. UHCC 0702]|nr:DUF4351 domain-containing protein [Nostoc sp. UHCC 0702]
MRESVIYQDILQQSKRQGEESLILPLINRRFGQLDASLIDRIRGLSIENLEALGEALFDFSGVTDLVAWLELQNQS